MTKYPEPPQVTEGILESPISYIREVTHHTDHINQVIRISSVQDLTEFNLDEENLASKSVEDKYMSS